MYSNTGEKITGLANAFLTIGIIASVILGLVVGVMINEATYEEGVAWLFGIIIIAIGCFSSYLSYLFLAGYGELIKNTQETHKQIDLLRKDIVIIKKNRFTEADAKKEAPKEKSYADKVADLLNKYHSGAITEEEFNAKTRNLS